MDPFLAVAGHTNLDVQIGLESLPVAGESRPVSSRRTVYGGTACNIAIHAAGLGVPTRLWSRVGRDFPADWEGRLGEAGVELAFAREPAGTPTCFVLTDATGEQAYCMDQAAMTPPYTVPNTVFADATWLHIATGDPDAYIPLAQAARRAAGVKVAFDPGQEIHFAYDAGRFERLLDLADVFFANRAELDKALGFMKYGDPVQLLDHVDQVVVTHGAKGVSLYEAGDHHVHLDAPRVDKVVDPTGAGDALRAGWYAGLKEGRSSEEALRLGQSAAAACIGFAGPQARVLQWTDLRP